MKHHYIPQCYLRQWTGADRMLCEYQRPFRQVVATRRYPSQTGYVTDLYTLDDLKAGDQYAVERKFFQKVDQGAADCIQALLDPTRSDIPDKLRVAWCVFLLTLYQRHPKKIEFLNQFAAAAGFSLVPEKGGMSAYAADLLVSGSTRDAIVTYLMGMQWHVCDIGNLDRTLLTCDMPVVGSDGLKHEWGHLLLPLSPRHFFVAVNRPQTLQHLQNDLTAGRLINSINDFVVKEAFKFVYGADDSHLRFVENRMAPKDQPHRSMVTSKRAEFVGDMSKYFKYGPDDVSSKADA